MTISRFGKILFYFLSLVMQAGANDSTSGTWNLQIRGDYGFIIAHREELLPIQQTHISGFEISVSKITSGMHEWEGLFNFPEYGITVAGFDLGSPDRLGKGFVVYPFIDFPLNKNNQGGLRFRYGMGIGYVEKIFHPDDNYKNAAISSHYNGVIHIDLHYKKSISEKSALGIGTGITHYSNGSFSIPNLGINIATVNIDYRHSFGSRSQFVKQSNTFENPPSEIHVYAGGFPKKTYPPKGRSYAAATLSAVRFESISIKSSWGAGIDVFYDQSLSARIERLEERKTNTKDDFRTGVYGAWQTKINRIGLMFNMGYYLYTPWKEEGNFYHRICFRYYFPKIFICMNLKTHYARADFVEMGLGYRFIKSKK